MGDLNVLHLVVDAETGGAQTLIRAMAEHRVASGRRDLVVLKGRGALSDTLEAAFDDVTYLGKRSSTIDFLGMRRRVQEHIITQRPSVVHSHLLHCDLLALADHSGTSRISTVHTSGFSKEDPLRTRMIGRLVASGSRRFDAVVACSASARQYIDRLRYRAPNIRQIDNGTSAVERRQRIEVGAPYILSLARWHPMKDHSTLFRSFAASGLHERGWRLLCAGNDVTPENSEAARERARSGVEHAIELLGSRSDVDQLIVNSRAVVISSAYGEAMPMAALEALARARIVVSTDVGSTREAVVDPTLLVPPRETSALAMALAHLGQISPDDIARLEDASIERFEAHFRIEEAVKSYEDLYREVLAVTR